MDNRAPGEAPKKPTSKLSKKADVVLFIIALIMFFIVFNTPGFTWIRFALAVVFLFILFFATEFMAQLLSIITDEFKSELAVGELGPAEFEEKKNLFADDTAALGSLGFELIFAGQVPTKLPITIFIYKNPETLTFINVQRVNKTRIFDMVSLFTAERGLTTSSTLLTGMPPIKEGTLLQVFENADYNRITDEHKRALAFVEERGLVRKDAGIEEYVALVNKLMLKKKEDIRGMSYWQYRVFWWMLTKPGKKFALPVEEQVKKGVTKI